MRGSVACRGGSVSARQDSLKCRSNFDIIPICFVSLSLSTRIKHCCLRRREMLRCNPGPATLYRKRGCNAAINTSRWRPIAARPLTAPCQMRTSAVAAGLRMKISGQSSWPISARPKDLAPSQAVGCSLSPVLIPFEDSATERGRRGVLSAHRRPK